MIFTFDFVIDRQNQSHHVFAWIQTDLLKCFLLSSSRPEVFCKKGVLRNFTKLIGKHPCQSFLFNKVAGLNLARPKPKPGQNSCEFCEISKNTFLHRASLVAASFFYIFLLNWFLMTLKVMSKNVVGHFRGNAPFSTKNKWQSFLL